MEGEVDLLDRRRAEHLLDGVLPVAAQRDLLGLHVPLGAAAADRALVGTLVLAERREVLRAGVQLAEPVRRALVQPRGAVLLVRVGAVAHRKLGQGAGSVFHNTGSKNWVGRLTLQNCAICKCIICASSACRDMKMCYFAFFL